LVLVLVLVLVILGRILLVVRQDHGLQCRRPSVFTYEVNLERASLLVLSHILGRVILVACDYRAVLKYLLLLMKLLLGDFGESLVVIVIFEWRRVI
jgi:hypothetical protein